MVPAPASIKAGRTKAVVTTCGSKTKNAADRAIKDSASLRCKKNTPVDTDCKPASTDYRPASAGPKLDIMRFFNVLKVGNKPVLADCTNLR